MHRISSSMKVSLCSLFVFCQISNPFVINRFRPFRRINSCCRDFHQRIGNGNRIQNVRVKKYGVSVVSSHDLRFSIFEA